MVKERLLNVIGILALSILSYTVCAQEGFVEPSETRSYRSGGLLSSKVINYDIYWGAGNSGQLRKPFILCEGYEAVRTDEHDKLAYEQLNGGGYDLRFLECLTARGYDVVRLDLIENTGAIQTNGAYVAGLIKEINQELVDNGSDHGLVLGGISMGGLVTRSALLQLENEGYDHRVEVYYAFDTPNQGANVPLGYQHLVGFAFAPVDAWISISSFLNTVNLNPLDLLTRLSYMEWANSFIDQSAALQMAANTYRVDPRRAELLAHFSSLGNYPNHVQKMVAISDGVNGTTLGFDSNDELFRLNFLRWCPIDQTIKLPFPANKVKDNVKIQWCPIDISMNANATGSALDEVFRINATQQPIPLGPKLGLQYAKTTMDRDMSKPQKDISNIDRAPGGTLDFGSELEFLGEGSIDIHIPIDVPIVNVKLPIIGRVKYNFRTTINATIPNPIKVSSESDYYFSFVPMVSAFDISINSWLYDLNNIPNFPYPLNDNITPFDVLIPHQIANRPHGYLREKPVGDCMLDEIAPADLYLEARTYNNNQRYAYEAANITMGNAVDPNVQRRKSGDLVVSNGSSLNLSASESIVLKPGTIFQSGSSVSVKAAPSTTGSWKFDVNGPCSFTTAPTNHRQGSVPDDGDEDTTTVIPTDSVAYDLLMVVDGMNGEDDTPVNAGARYSLPSDDLDEDFFEVTIYPNPADDVANILMASGQSSKVEVTVFGTNGQKYKVVEQNLKSGYNIIQLDVTQLKTGVYPVVIKQGNRKRKSKIVVSRQ